MELFALKALPFVLMVLIEWASPVYGNAAINGQCYDLVKQYFECKYLPMSLKNDTWQGLNYEPADGHKGLSDDFFKRRRLDRMSFDEAMRLFRTIYQVTDNCSSEFCNCVSWNHIDLNTNYSLLFRNETNFKQTTRIVKAFIDKFRSSLVPQKQIQNILLSFDFQQPSMPTLAKFCFNNDYSWGRLLYYDYTKLCSMPKFTFTDYYECEWSVNVANKTLDLNYTNSQLEDLLSCRLMYVGKCAPEGSRFYALLYWVTNFPQLEWHGTSLGIYFDKLLHKAASFKPKFNFRQTFVYSFGNFFTAQTFEDRFDRYENNATSLARNCFSSRWLTIDCQWKFESNDTSNLAAVNFTFFMDSSLLVSIPVNFSTMWPNLEQIVANDTVFKDSKGANWLQIFWNKYEAFSVMEIYDFSTNSHVSVYRDVFYLVSPLNFFKNSSGIIVSGFNSTHSVKERSYERSQSGVDCEKICGNKRMVSLVGGTFSAAFDSCLKKCNIEF